MVKLKGVGKIDHSATANAPKRQLSLKSQDQFITLPGAGHNGLTDTPDYLAAIQRILSKP
ncbi:hypothetical protein HNQ93_000972 [Hymenobacter luteus]|uniref:Uncharacterized protein n=2 Tax=Hymenobacter TaxID=89966 RepID=A0A7W9SYA3_9BACT|nr:hypothetical protein [Hymenobacter latericoloratus]MBB6058142.1 hypothetical protein [Hymenobacter luteus]